MSSLSICVGRVTDSNVEAGDFRLLRTLLSAFINEDSLQMQSPIAALLTSTNAEEQEALLSQVPIARASDNCGLNSNAGIILGRERSNALCAMLLRTEEDTTRAHLRESDNLAPQTSSAGENVHTSVSTLRAILPAPPSRWHGGI